MNMKKSATEKIFDNIIFLADVFGDLPDKGSSAIAGAGDGALFRACAVLRHTRQPAPAEGLASWN